MLQTAIDREKQMKPLRRNGFKTDRFSLKAIDFIKLTKKSRRTNRPRLFSYTLKGVHLFDYAVPYFTSSGLISRLERIKSPAPKCQP